MEKPRNHSIKVAGITCLFAVVAVLSKGTYSSVRDVPSKVLMKEVLYRFGRVP